MARSGIIDTWERMVRFHREATRRMDDHLRAEFGHSLDDYDVLHQVNSAGGPVRMGELAERLLVAKSSCNRIVGRLVEEGLVERHTHSEDGRVVLVELTASGRRLWRRMAAVHSRDIEAYVGAPLTPGDAEDLDAAVRRLLAALG